MLLDLNPVHPQLALQQPIENFERAYLRLCLSESHETLQTYASPHKEQRYLNEGTTPTLDSDWSMGFAQYLWFQRTQSCQIQCWGTIQKALARPSNNIPPLYSASHRTWRKLIGLGQGRMQFDFTPMQPKVALQRPIENFERAYLRSCLSQSHETLQR